MDDVRTAITENKIFWREFIKMYQSFPCLWKVNSSDYSNRVKKRKAYIKLVEKLKEIYNDADRELARKKINTLRTNYRRERKKQMDSQKPGASAQYLYVPSLWYYKLMTFLDDQLGKRMKLKESCIKMKTAPNPRKRKLDHDGNDHDNVDIFKMTMDKLTTSSKDKNCHDIVQYWNSQYKELESDQKILSRKIISDVLFHASLGKLDVAHAIKIQEILLERTENSTATAYLPDDDIKSDVSRSSTPCSYIDIKECAISKSSTLNSSQDINQSMEHLDSSSSHSFEDPLVERTNARNRSQCGTENSSFEMLANIKLMIKLNWSADDIMEALRKVYDDESPSRKQVLKWIQEFHESDDE